MSRKSGKKHSSSKLTDVTINDYANAIVAKDRLKKWTANVEQIVKKQSLEDTRSWDEKIDEYDGDLVKKENVDGTVSYVIRKKKDRNQKEISSQSRVSDSTKRNIGKVYHIDIWFLISKYIKPEDVGRFAAICRTSNEVVCTDKFWYSLYKRFYKDVPNLPECLQPNYVLRKFSLRASVVRALHYMYPPFINYYKLHKNFDPHPNVLRKTQCISIWHHKEKTHWAYFFKMRLPIYPHQERQQHRNILDLLDDISANQEKDCRILKVNCEHLIPVPPVLGYNLLSAELNLSNSLNSYKLQLWFGSEIQTTAKPSTGGSTLIVLNPVTTATVLDWWHPLYPHHPNNMENLFKEE